jgi:MFS family permease
MQVIMGGLLVSSILLFFASNRFWVMLVSMALFGVSLGAQKVLNQLWITIVVDAQKVADYISAFSILNGVRGILAPVFAYWLLSFTSPGISGVVSAGIIGLGTICLIYIRKSVSGNQYPEFTGHQ